MTVYTLNEVQIALMQHSKGPALGNLIRSVTMDDLEALAETLGQLDGQSLDRINYAAISVKSPVVMLSTIRSTDGSHPLSFHQTSSMIDTALKLREASALTLEQCEQSVSWLISRFSTKHDLSLLTELSSVYQKGTVLHLSRDVDEALAEHFEKTKHRHVEWNDFLKICDWLPRSAMRITLTALLSHYKAHDGFEEIKQIFKDCWEKGHLETTQIRAFTEGLGSEMAATLIQDHMISSPSSSWSLQCVRESKTEARLYDGNFKETIVQNLLKPVPSVPKFFDTIAKSNLDLEEWPITATLMIEHYTRVFDIRASLPRDLDGFAIKHGLQKKLIEKKIDALRIEFVSMDEWNFDSIMAKTHAEIFSMGATQRAGDQKKDLRYKQLMESCKNIDLIEMKDLLGELDGKLVLELLEQSTLKMNPKEVMKHYPQVKGLLLERDLGM